LALFNIRVHNFHDKVFTSDTLVLVSGFLFVTYHREQSFLAVALPVQHTAYETGGRVEV
jgi:hypothetical protein